MSAGARRRGAVLCAGILGLLGLWFLRERADRSTASPPQGSREPAVAARRPAVSAVDMAKVKQLVEDPVLVATYLERFKEANRYPPTTLRLAPGMLDALEPDRHVAPDVAAPWVRNLYTRPAQRIYYRFETDKVRYTAPAPIVIKLAVFRGDQRRAPVDVLLEPVQVTRVRPSGTQARLDEVRLSKAAEGSYEATYSPPLHRGAVDDDVLQFEVAWRLADGKGRQVRDRWLVQYTSQPPAFFTGRFIDRLEQGSLRIDAELESSRDGEAQVSANLFASDATTPVATAILTTKVRRGAQWIPLQFYGLAIRERGLPGPYVVRTLRGHFPSMTSAGRGPELAPFQGSYTTAAYALHSFTEQEWDSPEKRAGIAAYQAALERTEAEDVPDSAERPEALAQP